jgi:hypothetical protein
VIAEAIAVVAEAIQSRLPAALEVLRAHQAAGATLLAGVGPQDVLTTRHAIDERLTDPTGAVCAVEAAGEDERPSAPEASEEDDGTVLVEVRCAVARAQRDALGRKVDAEHTLLLGATRTLARACELAVGAAFRSTPQVIRGGVAIRTPLRRGVSEPDLESTPHVCLVSLTLAVPTEDILASGAWEQSDP